jgi:hypothetical protein
MSENAMIALSEIAVPLERLRALQPDKVDAIAESMKTLGQLQDVLLRERPGHGYWLVAGYHRLEAARKLKWDLLRCVVLEGVSADQAELAEIDENLIRAGLTPAEQALHVARRKELYENQHPETKHGAIGRGREKSGQLGHSNGRFTKETARKTGQSERRVRRDATRGKKVKVLADITGTCLDKGEELDALAKLDEAQQRKLAEIAKAGEKVSAKQQVKKIKGSIDPALDTIQQADLFHQQLMDWTEEFCCRVEAWRAMHASLDEETKFCVTQALELSATRLQRLAQALDDRSRIAASGDPMLAGASRKHQ